MRITSLAGRLVASLILVTLVFGVVAAATGSITLHREINEAMDNSMREAARRLLPLVIDDLFGRDATDAPRELADAVADDGDEHLVFQVRNGDGRVLMHSHDAPAQPLTSQLVPGFTDENDWRIYGEAAVSGTLFIQVAEREARRGEETLEAATGFLVPIVVLTPLTALMAWLVLRSFLKPIGALRGEIGARHGDHLAPIRTEELPSELAAIAKSVNSLMRRLRMALDAEKEFTANAAHELRTPLAGALAQAERLMSETADPAVLKRVGQIRSALTGLSRLSEKLMQLARADAGVAETSKPLDLSAIAALVVEEFDRRTHSMGRIRLDAQPPGRALVAIDPDALAIVLRNLIENALLHGRQDSPVIVRVSEAGGFSVINDGPVVADTDGLVRRFQRGQTRAAGSGLGLAIVARILQQAGATLELNSPATNRKGGFEAVVRF